jgi:predicted transcriptional regulator
MDTIKSDRNHSDESVSQETEAEKQRRFAWEAETIAEARAQLDAGFYVDATAVDAWIDSLDTDNEPPPPPIRRR